MTSIYSNDDKENMVNASTISVKKKIKKVQPMPPRMAFTQRTALAS
jgi:hypothetical protein